MQQISANTDMQYTKTIPADEHHTLIKLLCVCSRNSITCSMTAKEKLLLLILHVLLGNASPSTTYSCDNGFV